MVCLPADRQTDITVVNWALQRATMLTEIKSVAGLFTVFTSIMPGATDSKLSSDVLRMYRVVQKCHTQSFLPQLHQLLADFKNPFTGTLRSKVNTKDPTTP